MGIVPDLFKISRITPIYKSGVLTDPNNYIGQFLFYPHSVKLLNVLSTINCCIFLKKTIFSLNISSAFGKGILLNRLFLKLLKI